MRRNFKPIIGNAALFFNDLFLRGGRPTTHPVFQGIQTTVTGPGTAPSLTVLHGWSFRVGGWGGSLLDLGAGMGSVLVHCRKGTPPRDRETDTYVRCR